MNTRPQVAEQVKQFERDTPLGRMATPEEMIGPTVFLLSDAASFCTGIDLIVDGGLRVLVTASNRRAAPPRQLPDRRFRPLCTSQKLPATASER